MNKKRLFTKSLVAVAITMASQQAMAAGFQLNSQSATGLGRAFAGDAVIADNASVMSRNAAAMALFDAPAISLGINVIDTDIDVKNTSANIPMVGSIPVEDASVGDASYVPNIYYIHPINEQWTVGASIYSNFGTKTEFPDGYGQDQTITIPGPGGSTTIGPDLFGGLTDVKSINFGLSAAYRINEQWSLGAGVDIIYGEGKLKRGRGLNADPSNPNLVDIDADGVGFGFNLGAVYELNEDNRFGLSYRYSLS